MTRLISFIIIATAITFSPKSFGNEGRPRGMCYLLHVKAFTDNQAFDRLIYDHPFKKAGSFHNAFMDSQIELRSPTELTQFLKSHPDFPWKVHLEWLLRRGHPKPDELFFIAHWGPALFKVRDYQDWHALIGRGLGADSSVVNQLTAELTRGQHVPGISVESESLLKNPKAIAEETWFGRALGRENYLRHLLTRDGAEVVQLENIVSAEKIFLMALFPQLVPYGQLLDHAFGKTPLIRADAGPREAVVSRSFRVIPEDSIVVRAKISQGWEPSLQREILETQLQFDLHRTSNSRPLIEVDEYHWFTAEYSRYSKLIRSQLPEHFVVETYNGHLLIKSNVDDPYSLLGFFFYLSHRYPLAQAK